MSGGIHSTHDDNTLTRSTMEAVEWFNAAFNRHGGQDMRHGGRCIQSLWAFALAFVFVGGWGPV